MTVISNVRNRYIWCKGKRYNEWIRKNIAFTITFNLVFLDSMQCMNSSLDSFVKKLLGNDFECLS